MSFLSGLPEAARKRRTIVALQIWTDESGDKGQRGYMTIGGLMGSAEHWAAFSEKWDKRCLAPPSIRFLSTREAAGLNNQFGRFSSEQRDEKLASLMALTDDFDFHLVQVSVDLEMFEAYRPRIQQKVKPQVGDSLLQTFVGQPYFFCFYQLSVALANVLLRRLPEGEKFEWYLDEKKILSERVEAWYPLLVGLLMDDQQTIMPARPIFRDDEKEAPLQIADFVAYVVRAELSGHPHPFQAAFDRLHIGFDGVSLTYDDKALRAFFEMNLDEPVDRGLINQHITGEEWLRRLKKVLGRDIDDD